MGYIFTESKEIARNMQPSVWGK